MPYEPYATAVYYCDTYKGIDIPQEDQERALKLASRHIDSLTYNRIVGRGIVNLTDFQRGIIQEVCCLLAEFEYENADLIESVLKSYTLNGVSMSFGDSWNVVVENGVAIRRDVYNMLCQTGLCNRRLK